MHAFSQKSELWHLNQNWSGNNMFVEFSHFRWNESKHFKVLSNHKNNKHLRPHGLNPNNKLYSSTNFPA
jgi:hypothetical protein